MLAMGDEGYLTDKGLIPLDETKYKAIHSDIKNLKNLSM